ncbi:hypothetical protein CSA56_15280 [candidate division KSB3 bacterium]|uniref:Calcineurin-like phosphoesterase domain-containing protein n=1 Tax=candidate division KSB3 bacterium TaxID=2044937 RepID=A0A2G6K9Y8_9BACT|nr:MAG: hypothetical protein CSA56_15280 [candidate division KSB3 bacterium]
MTQRECFFVSDLHGHRERYHTLFELIEQKRPYAVLLGGDLLPSGMLDLISSGHSGDDFVDHVLVRGFLELQRQLGSSYPHVVVILGNDDARLEETALQQWGERGLWHYVHNRRFTLDEYTIFGYSYVPPTPFLLKDWERYDVSRFVDPGCVAPEEGYHSLEIPDRYKQWATIQEDLASLIPPDRDLQKTLLLFHAPPYHTKLDRAALDGKMIDAVPLDVHIGSIAIRRFIEQRQPYVTLHGHVHESARMTGAWQEHIGRTHCFSAAHDGPELAVVRFDIECPAHAQRELIACDS